MTSSFVILRRPLQTLALFALAAAAPRLAAQSEGISWEPHTLRTLDGRERTIELGRILVPESRRAPESPKLSVAFLRLTSTSAAPGSPIVFLMGGPGVAASLIAPIPPYWDLFDSLSTIADVILLDQRGLGHSRPTLDCPGGIPPASNFFSSRAAFEQAYRAVVERCAQHYFSRGSAPRTLTDAAIADDIEAIRVGLGARLVSLLGFSYGSRLAMTFARRHPESVDRIVLQGPTDEQLMYRSSAPYDTLFRRIAAAAARDSASAPFSADLVTRMRALLDRAAAQPFIVRLGNPRGDSVGIPVGRETLAGLITGRLGDPRLPAAIATLEQGDMSIIRVWVGGAWSDLMGGAGSLMARALPCSQRPSDARTAAVDVSDIGTIFGPAFDNFAISPSFCSALGGGAAAPTSEPHRTLRRPALLIVGDRDDRTPPANAAALNKEFRDATTLIVREGGHELLPVPEVRRAVIDFFRGISVSGRKLSVPAPRYFSIEEARLPPRRPGS